MNPGGGGCSEPISCHCTLAWAKRVKLHLKTKKLEPRADASVRNVLGPARWLTPVIPAIWEAKEVESSEVRSLRLAWPKW